MCFDSLLLLPSRFSLHHKQAFIAIFKDFSPPQKVSRYTPSQTWELKGWFQNNGDSPLMVSFFPYDSHIKIWGFLWEWYGNIVRVPGHYWGGVPGNLTWWYCWWKKSCTTWDGWNPINNGIDIYHINWCRISSINRSTPKSNSKLPVAPHVVRLQKVVKQENDTNASVEPEIREIQLRDQVVNIPSCL